MEVAAIIAEYNPFHSGHQYQIQRIREAGFDVVVAVMSGNFVQRGEAAIFSKWLRATAAVSCGVDLVLELPAPYVLSSAEGFSFGALSLLKGMDVPFTLCFGTERGEAEDFFAAAKGFSDPNVKELFGQKQKEGKSYPRAWFESAKAFLPESVWRLFTLPNSLLGVLYCKQILEMELPQRIFPLQRKGVLHHQAGEVGGIASASFLRWCFRTGDFSVVSRCVPENTAERYRQIAKEGMFTDPSLLEKTILYLLSTMPLDALLRLPGVSEGLEHKIRGDARQSRSLLELEQKLKSKRYPLSRLRRIFGAALVGADKALSVVPAPYIRVLDMNETGQKLLKEIKRRKGLPVYHSFSELKRDFPSFGEKEEQATRAFSLALRTPSLETEYKDLHRYTVKQRLMEEKL